MLATGRNRLTDPVDSGLVDDREGLNRCLRFRDTLRAHRQLAAEYVALKRALAARFREDRAGYTKAKSSFINDADSHAGPLSSPLRDERSPTGTSSV